MKSNYQPLVLVLLTLPTLTACGSGGRLTSVAGTVSVDGQPVDSGTIHFQSKASSSMSGGAAVSGGSFNVASSQGFEPGDYDVVLQAYQKTGRTINDPQKGKVEVTTSVNLKDSPKVVSLTAGNAHSLAVDFTSAKK